MDFALIMVLLMLLTGGAWMLYRFALKPRRAPDAKEPWWAEYARSFFPIILAVFLLRSFLVEPFRIPSGSMIPTLQIGDFILVNKFTYGIRIPVIDKKIIDVNTPKRGDVMVFRYPNDPSTNFIKRVVGLPGDTVKYDKDKRLFVNGIEQMRQPDGAYNYQTGDLRLIHTDHYRESLDGHEHEIILNPDRPSVNSDNVENFPFREACDYNKEEMHCTVPRGYYFMMGDNRDDSQDGRYWGFVPDSYIVGKAFIIWMNFSNLKRIGMSVK